MKNIIIGLVMVLFMLAGTSAFACAISCPIPKVVCECNATVQLPGLWEVNIQNVKRCGKVTVISGASAIVENERDGKVFFLLNKVRRMNQVESCD